MRFGEIVRPLQSVGCYVPGGRAVYPSSVCMTVVPAVVAGVDEIVLCTPPQSDGSIPSSVLYAAQEGRRPLRGEDRRRPGGRGDGLRHRVDPEGRPHRRTRQRLCHRGQASGRGERRHRRARRTVGARDRRRRRRRHRHGGARPDRPGRTRPRGAHVLHHARPRPRRPRREGARRGARRRRAVARSSTPRSTTRRP